MKSWIVAIGVTLLAILFAGFLLGLGVLIGRFDEMYPVMAHWLFGIGVFAGVVAFIRWALFLS